VQLTLQYLTVLPTDIFHQRKITIALVTDYTHTYYNATLTKRPSLKTIIFSIETIFLLIYPSFKKLVALLVRVLLLFP
jgi:hypothetical protein